MDLVKEKKVVSPRRSSVTRFGSRVRASYFVLQSDNTLKPIVTSTSVQVDIQELQSLDVMKLRAREWLQANQKTCVHYVELVDKDELKGLFVFGFIGEPRNPVEVVKKVEVKKEGVSSAIAGSSEFNKKASTNRPGLRSVWSKAKPRS